MNKQKTNGQEKVSDASITKLDKEIIAIEKKPPKKGEEVPNLVTDFLPWCPLCENAVIDQKGYGCEKCGKTVCRYCINITKKGSFCDKCAQDTGIKVKDSKKLSYLNPKFSLEFIWIFWIIIPAIALIVILWYMLFR